MILVEMRIFIITVRHLKGLNCLQFLQALAELNKIPLEWVPEHEGVLEHKKAYLLTKKGTEKL